MNHQFKNVIVRIPGKNFADGLTTSVLGKPDYSKMLKQHTAYVNALKSLDLDVIILPAEQQYPDAHFVEDTAVVFPEAVVITRPGHPARQGEEITIRPVLEKYRKIYTINAPSTIDGGDVMRVDTVFYIGVSSRTNVSGIRQFDKIVTRFGYTCVAIPVGEGLHLKSGVNYLGQNTLLMSAEFSGKSEFDGFEKIILTEEESYAGNTLLVNNTLLTPSGFPSVKEKLEKLEMPIIELNMSEVQKMDGGLTCLSLRF